MMVIVMVMVMVMMVSDDGYSDGDDGEWGVLVLNPLLLIASWLPLLAALSAILHLSKSVDFTAIQ